MSLTTTALIGGGVLVEGTDAKGTDGSTVLRSDLWEQVKAYRAKAEAQGVFDAAVEEFFKPLTEAAKASAAQIRDDEDTVVILDEGIQLEAGREPIAISLDPDGVVLRLLDEGRSDQLRWVGGHLVALRA